MPDSHETNVPLRPGRPERMAIMNNETVTRFHRVDSGPRGPGADAGLEGDEVGMQHVAALHRLYDPILSEPVPAQMLALLRRHRGS